MHMLIIIKYVACQLIGINITMLIKYCDIARTACIKNTGTDQQLRIYNKAMQIYY